MHTLDDESKQRTKDVRGNTGVVLYEAIETKDVGGNASSNIGVAHK